MSLKNKNIPYDFYLAQVCVKIIDAKAEQVWKKLLHERVAPD